MITTALDLEFADGSYLFDLKLPQLAELQEKRGAGVFAIYARVLRGRFLLGDVPVADTAQGEAYVEDLFETVRLGLVGGGTPAGEARKLVERYCHAAPLKESWALAAAILGARIEGYIPPGEAPAGGGPAPDRTGSTSETP